MPRQRDNPAVFLSASHPPTRLAVRLDSCSARSEVQARPSGRPGREQCIPKVMQARPRKRHASRRHVAQRVANILANILANRQASCSSNTFTRTTAQKEGKRERLRRPPQAFSMRAGKSDFYCGTSHEIHQQTNGTRPCYFL